MKKYLFIGDSLTRGFGVSNYENFVYLLMKDSNYEYINKGLNGATSTNILCDFSEILNKSSSYKNVFLMCGTNDLLCNRPVTNILSNIEEMIKECLNKNITLYIGIPPTIIPEMANLLFCNSDTYDYCLNSLPILRNKLLNLCTKYNIQYIDFYYLTKNNLENNIYLDGIHLNPLGHKLLAKKLKEYLK